MAKIIAYTKVLTTRWRVYAFEAEGFTGVCKGPEDFTLTGGAGEKVTSAEVKNGVLRVEVEPIFWEQEFALTGCGLELGPKTADEVKIDWVDKFECHKDHDIVYRLYRPQAYGPRPLVLFLHGGGECGDDNLKQMVGTLGAARIAEDYPDCFVMAPQAPQGFINPLADPAQAAKMMNRPFAQADMKGDRGWSRPYLAKVCDVIRELIADGKVLADRVTVTGLSMGGFGTLRAMSVGSDIFAAAAPICPSMTPETYTILKGLTHAKVWVSTAYVDHTIYRHKYITDAIMYLQQQGNKDAYLTLYSPEELAAYGHGVDPELPYKKLFAENHNAWNLTYSNEHGIMSWLIAQTKEKG